MKTTFDQNILNELIDQSHNPPGKDPTVGAFYGAILQMIDNHTSMRKLLKEIKLSRFDITDKHFVNLLYRAYQFIRMENSDFGFRSFETIEQWVEELGGLLSERKLKRKIKKILLTKSTTTTIYQRYAGPYIIIANKFMNKKVTIADLGCGGNYGIRGIELNEKFHAVIDETETRLISNFLKSRLDLKLGLAVDKEIPDDEDVFKWRLACSFYPNEMDNFKATLDFEERIRKSRKVFFIKADLLSIDWSKELPKLNLSPNLKVDVVILSTILYQLPREQQFILIEKAKKLLKPAGILLVQDFAARNLEDLTLLDFSDSWFGKSYSYGTFAATKKSNWRFMEVLRWQNGRCKIVKEGSDFHDFFKLNHASSPKADFAHSTS